MIVHFYNSSSYIYFQEWYRILEKTVSNTKHVIFVLSNPNNFPMATNLQERNEIYFLHSKYEFLKKLVWSIFKAKRIIIHYLDPESRKIALYILCVFARKKITWVLWGGDLYHNILQEPKNIKSRFKTWLLKRIVLSIDEIAAFLKEDFDIAVASTGTKARYRYLFYPNPVNFDMLDQQSEKVSQMMKNKSTLKIMIGNSANPSNNHFEILDFLNKISKKIDVEIICPLSYGDLDYAKSVIAYGKEKFGDRFIPLTKILEPEEYAKLLVNADIAIFNHKRQQALGNILALLYARKKVYIRSDISTWKFFERYGIRVYDTQTLISGEDANFERFDQKIGEKNREIVAKEFGSERCAELWKKAFEDYINE